MGMSFSKIMALIPVLTRDPRLSVTVSDVVPDRFAVARSSSWDRLLWLVRERPATAVVLDSGALPEVGPEPDERIADLRRRFPSLGCVLVSRKGTNRLILLRLGRAAISNLELVQYEDVRSGLARAIGRSSAHGARSFVLRALGARLPRVERQVVRAALDGALLGWQADELAGHSGWTRPHLSVRLKACGLPSTGHLLIWAKLLHAGHWLTEPGRSAESISRQLEYANGPVFRRALRNYVGATPTDVRERGGLSFVLRCFLDVCGLDDSLRAELSVA